MHCLLSPECVAAGLCIVDPFTIRALALIVLLSAHIISIYFYTCNTAQSCTKENLNALSCLLLYPRRKYIFVCLSFFLFLSAHNFPHSPSSPQSLFARRRNAVAEVCFGIKHPSGNTRIILSCHASFPSYTGMNMHWHLVIENALSPWTHDLTNFTRVSCHQYMMLPPLSCQFVAPGHQGEEVWS